jgi:Zn-dependent protease
VTGGNSELGKHIAVYLVAMLLSLTVHEYAHARVADLLGDDTPRSQGRLTLSPLAHYDVLGTFIIPIIAMLGMGIPLVGWARPVETNPGRYTRRISMRNGHRLVAAAGPLANLLMAFLATGGIWLINGTPVVVAASGGVLMLLVSLMQVNLGLFVLNMLPIPPLDGSRLLPKNLDSFQRAIAPYSFFIILVLLNVPVLRSIFYWPVAAIGTAMQSVFGFDMGPA